MKILIAAALVPLILAACAPLEALPSDAGLAAADPVRILSPAPNGPTVAYAGYRVIQPADWRAVNDGQAGN